MNSVLSGEDGLGGSLRLLQMVPYSVTAAGETHGVRRVPADQPTSQLCPDLSPHRCEREPSVSCPAHSVFSRGQLIPVLGLELERDVCVHLHHLEISSQARPHISRQLLPLGETLVHRNGAVLPRCFKPGSRMTSGALGWWVGGQKEGLSCSRAAQPSLRPPGTLDSAPGP